MAPDRGEEQSTAGDNHSREDRLADAYHRIDGQSPGVATFVLIFEDGAQSFTVRRGESRELIAARIQEFAESLAG